jgi:hypothetical protein
VALVQIYPALLEQRIILGTDYVILIATQQEQDGIVRGFYARLHTPNGQKFLRHILTFALQEEAPN